MRVPVRNNFNRYIITIIDILSMYGYIQYMFVYYVNISYFTCQNAQTTWLQGSTPYLLSQATPTDGLSSGRPRLLTATHQPTTNSEFRPRERCLLDPSSGLSVNSELRVGR